MRQMFCYIGMTWQKALEMGGKVSLCTVRALLLQGCRAHRDVGHAADTSDIRQENERHNHLTWEHPASPCSAPLCECQGGKCSPGLDPTPGAHPFPSQLYYHWPLRAPAAHLGSIPSSLHALIIPVSPLSTAPAPHEWSPEGLTLTPIQASGCRQHLPFCISPCRTCS